MLLFEVGGRLGGPLKSPERLIPEAIQVGAQGIHSIGVDPVDATRALGPAEDQAVILYLSGKDLERLTEGVKPLPDKEVRGVGLEIVPLPGEQGFLGFPVCGPDDTPHSTAQKRYDDAQAKRTGYPPCLNAATVASTIHTHLRRAQWRHLLRIGGRWQQRDSKNNWPANHIVWFVPGERVFLVFRLSETGQTGPQVAARGRVVRAERQSDGHVGIAVHFSSHRFL